MPACFGLTLCIFEGKSINHNKKRHALKGKGGKISRDKSENGNECFKKEDDDDDDDGGDDKKTNNIETFSFEDLQISII